MANRTKLTPKKKGHFLEELRVDSNVTRAASKIGVSRDTLYRHRQEDETFRADWDRSVEIGVSALEGEAIRRAYEGVDKPIYQQKELVGYIREYSDTLLIFLLKAHKPEKYRERFEHTGPGGGPIKMENVVIYLPDNGRDDTPPAGATGGVPQQSG